MNILGKEYEHSNDSWSTTGKYLILFLGIMNASNHKCIKRYFFISFFSSCREQILNIFSVKVEYLNSTKKV